MVGYLCPFSSPDFCVLDRRTGQIAPFLSRDRLNRFKDVNDLVFGSKGELFFTDRVLTRLHDPSGRLYHQRANGRLYVLVDTIPSPNGLVLDRTETRVFGNVTRANAIWRVLLSSSGEAMKVRTLFSYREVPLDEIVSLLTRMAV